jgi:hypothetical protein
MAKSKTGRKKFLKLCALFFVIFLSSCDPSCTQDNPLLDAFKDNDADGWYDENRNQNIQIFIDSVDNNSGSMFNEHPAIAIDDRIIAFSNHDFERNVPVTTRTVGNWGAPERSDGFGADLRVTGGDIFSAERLRFTFSNMNATFNVTHNGFTVHFRTVVSLFPDPSPDSALGDVDADGLTDSDEAKINSGIRSEGSPLEKDILLAVGFTHPDWKLTRKSQDLLTTAFFAVRRINLTIYTETDTIRDITPGIVTINGSTSHRDHELTLEEGGRVRPQLVNDKFRHIFHVLVLAEKLEDGAWGWSEGSRPANALVCRSHLPVSGPDFLDYQAKDIMHELGHNLGLCHPTISDSTCLTGSIPISERNGGLSAMGTPAESAGPVEQMIEALTRPLNYTPGQWQNVDLTLMRVMPTPTPTP